MPEQVYRNEALLSHTGFTSGCNDHPVSIKNRTGELNVKINFQEEFLRHKRVVNSFDYLDKMYQELDPHFHKTFGYQYNMGLLEGTQAHQRHVSKIHGIATSLVLDLYQGADDKDNKKDGNDPGQQSDTVSNLLSTPRTGGGTKFDPYSKLNYEAEKNICYQLMKAVREENETKSELNKLAGEEQIDKICELHEEMKRFTDEKLVQFETQKEVALYYEITDQLNNLLKLKGSKMLMEEKYFWPTLSTVIKGCRLFMTYLSKGPKKYGKEGYDGVGTTSGAAEGIQQKLDTDTLASTEDEGEKMSQATRDKMTYMFDCLLKSLLLIVDAVLDDRAQYAKDEKSNAVRQVGLLELSAEKVQISFDQQLAQLKAEADLQNQGLKDQVASLVKEKKLYQDLNSEYELRLKEALCLDKQVEAFDKVRRNIVDVQLLLNDVNVEREVQIDTVGNMLDMINIAGNMVPDRIERGTQTQWHIPSVSPHIFTEIDGDQLQGSMFGQMQSLVSLKRYMPKGRKIQAACEPSARNSRRAGNRGSGRNNARGKADAKATAAQLAAMPVVSEDPMYETKELFDKIISEKTDDDNRLRKQRIDCLSLDEFTATRFIKEYPTLHEAAEKLNGHLELLHYGTATDELVEIELEPGEKPKSAKTPTKVVAKAPHLYAIYISKLYGLNGQKRTMGDITEFYFLLRGLWNKKSGVSTVCPYGQRSLVEMFTWCKTYFDKSDDNPDAHPSPEAFQFFVLQQRNIGIQIMEALWEYNSPGESELMSVKSVPCLLSVAEMKTLPKTILDANLKQKINKDFTPEFFEKLSMTVFQIVVEMQATLAQHGYNTKTAHSKQKSSIESVDTPCFGDLLREGEKTPGMITMAKFQAIFTTPASPIVENTPESAQATPPDSPSKVAPPTLPKFGFWVSDDQLDILSMALDPTDASKKGKDVELSTMDIIRIFEKAEVNIGNVRISTIRFGLCMLNALEHYITDQVPHQLTQQVAKIAFPAARASTKDSGSGPSRSEEKKLDKFAASLPYDSFSKFKDVAMKFKPKMDDYAITKIFLRSNIILHMPELTRTDEFSVGKREEHGANKMTTAFAKKIVNLVKSNLDEQREEIIANTIEHNQRSAFGHAFIDVAGEIQSLIGTFYDHSKKKYRQYKNLHHKLAIEAQDRNHAKLPKTDSFIH